MTNDFVKEAILGKLFTSLSSKITRNIGKAQTLHNIGSATRHAVGGTGVGFKGIAVKKAPSFAREVSSATHSVGMPSEKFFNVDDIIQRTAGGIKDTAAPWRGDGSLFDKARDAAKQTWHSIKYKPGEVFERGGKMYQNVHERTMLGKIGYGATFSTPGVAATSYLTAPKDSKNKAGKAIGEGVTWGRALAPITVPVSTAKMGLDLAKGLLKKDPNRTIGLPKGQHKFNVPGNDF